MSGPGIPTARNRILLRSSIINNRAAANSGTLPKHLARRIDKRKSICISLSAVGNQPTWLVTISVTYRQLAFRRENEREKEIYVGAFEISSIDSPSLLSLHLKRSSCCIKQMHMEI